MLNTLVTHNGTFHADDVFAAATFLLAHPESRWQIIRTRDGGVIKSAAAVIDVGGEYDPSSMRFDHHQTGGSGVRENTIPYAAFGLVWKEYGAVVCGGDFFVAKQIDDTLVSSIDANDNGVELAIYDGVTPFDLSRYVHCQNLTWKEEEEWGEQGEAKRLEIFLKLVDFASGLIQREIKRYKDKNSAYELVRKVFEASSNKELIVFDSYYPWKDVLIEYKEPLIAIYPTDGGKKWAAATVPVRKNSFESRILFPLQWAGKRDQELVDISGVPGAIFCHNARFLAIAESKDGAIALARKALKLD